MELDAIKALADEFKNNEETYFFGGVSNIEGFNNAVDMFGVVVERLNRVPVGLIAPLMRVVASYAANSTDEDKNEVIAKITGEICPLLETVQTMSEVIGLWADFWETLSGLIADAKDDEDEGAA